MLLCYEHLIHLPATRDAKNCNHGDLIKEAEEKKAKLRQPYSSAKYHFTHTCSHVSTLTSAPLLHM